jgi:hypothetical protein
VLIGRHAFLKDLRRQQLLHLVSHSGTEVVLGSTHGGTRSNAIEYDTISLWQHLGTDGTRQLVSHVINALSDSLIQLLLLVGIERLRDVSLTFDASIH